MQNHKQTQVFIFFHLTNNCVVVAWSNFLGSTAYKLLHASLVEQPYQKKFYFCSLVTKSNQACMEYSPKYMWPSQKESLAGLSQEPLSPLPYHT